MPAEKLENRVEALEARISKLEDIAAIERLQRAYGYYLEHWMAPEIIDCFADGPDVTLVLREGAFVGKESIRGYFDREEEVPWEFLHLVMQLSGVIDIAPDGKTAIGRWYGFGPLAIPLGSGVRQSLMSGIYLMEYVKENGVWKFTKLQYNRHFDATLGEGWVKPERIAAIESDATPRRVRPDVPRVFDPRYPSGYIAPFHYKHPVTGKETSVKKHNEAILGEARPRTKTAVEKL